MNRAARIGVLCVSVVIFCYAGLGHVLGRTPDDKAYKSLTVYSEVLQKIQQDYVDEPNLHLVTSGSLHGMLESLDPQSSYLTAARVHGIQAKAGRQCRRRRRPHAEQALWLHHCDFRSAG